METVSVILVGIAAIIVFILLVILIKAAIHNTGCGCDGTALRKWEEKYGEESLEKEHWNQGRLD